MIWRLKPARTALFVVCATSVAIGCVSVRSQRATETESMLGAAGFEMKRASDPDARMLLDTVPSREIVKRVRSDGSSYYVYADAKWCKCVYVGDEKAYEDYQAYAVMKKYDDTKAPPTAVEEQEEREIVEYEEQEGLR